jgi:hypothetical protein
MAEKLPEGINRTLYDIAQGYSGLERGFKNTVVDLGRREKAFYQGIGDFFSGKTPNWNAAFTAGAPAFPDPNVPGAAPSPQNRLTPNQADYRDKVGQWDPNINKPGPAGPSGPSAPSVNPIDALFAPMFESLAQREQLANQRYEANREQVTNIYGQITGARTADIATTGEAFRRLSDAASSRSSAVNTSIDESEAVRLRNNQAALESMGLGGLSTSQGDIASQGAAMAKNTNQLNAENWQNLLTAMGATSQDLARSDVTGFNYRMGEDLGQLRGARENFQEDIGRERTNLITQQAQARFDFQQSQLAAAASAAAAARSATNAADRAAAERAQDLLDSSDPLTRATSRGIELGYVNFDPVKVQDAYNGWMINRGTTPTAAGRTSWDKGSAIADAMKFIGDQLSNDEKRALQEAIGNSY